MAVGGASACVCLYCTYFLYTMVFIITTTTGVVIKKMHTYLHYAGNDYGMYIIRYKICDTIRHHVLALHSLDTASTWLATSSLHSFLFLSTFSTSYALAKMKINRALFFARAFSSNNKHRADRGATKARRRRRKFWILRPAQQNKHAQNVKALFVNRVFLWFACW